MSGARCGICPRGCLIREGGTGFCGARANRGGRIIDKNYGMISSMALDPIEKKPLKRFYPGSLILSVGSYGCNLRCPFCQNHEISLDRGAEAGCVFVSPGELVKRAEELVPAGNIGIAYTYNEPLIGYEYVFDCASLASERGLKNVLVTNGYIAQSQLGGLLGLIDAANIDLKSFSEEFYKRIGGDLETVKRTIAAAARKCHVEVTVLIIPGENDGEDEMKRLSGWIASVDRDIPLHISRFFPRHLMADREPTPVAKVYALAEIARKSLSYVYEGNC